MSTAPSRSTRRAVLAGSAGAGTFGLALMLALSGGSAFSAQEKYSLQVPNGLALADFRGYEDWADVAVSQTATSIKAIVANPIMMDAYRAGVPGNGRKFPDGAKIAKIEWSSKRNTEAPYFVMVPNALKTLAFIEKDSRRFPDTSGWGYAKFDYDPASDTLTPDGNDAKCGYACHTIAAARDYIFTAYPKR